MKHEKILEELGGYRAVADRLDLHPTTVFKWARDGIPHKRWLQVEKLAKRMGSPKITLELIARGYPKKDHSI